MSLSTFYSGLSDTKRDLVIQLANNIQKGVAPERIEKMREVLVQVKAEIDQINRRRQILGADLEVAEAILDELDSYLQKTPDDTEVELLRAYLVGLCFELREEIEELRPNDKLRKKFEIQRRMRRLSTRSKIANLIFTAAVGFKRESSESMQQVVAQATPDNKVGLPENCEQGEERNNSVTE